MVNKVAEAETKAEAAEAQVLPPSPHAVAQARRGTQIQRILVVTLAFQVQPMMVLRRLHLAGCLEWF